MPFTSFCLLFFLFAGLFSTSANAQLVNGQYFTRGLAISNAPAPNSEFTVGGTISVSVDVSGNGRLPQGSWGPNSTLPSGFISLSIYLVSDSRNLTIVDGTAGAFLAGEPGSTVKHLNYVIPSCLPEGNYDYTYYEVSRMNGTTFFGITPIPLRIRNPGRSSGACDANITNTVQQRPQNDSAPAQNPFTGGLALNTSNATPSGATVTVFVPALQASSPSAPNQTTQTPSVLAPNPTPTTGMAIYNNQNAQAALQAAGLVFPIRASAATSLHFGSGMGIFGSLSRAALLSLSIFGILAAW